ncbi:hypothetical protein BJQ94_06135 [Cryobacterium sp. SO2]|uniref:hypothetical protein n=1 Tax=Cryobacterium sp. SO2 TaxID=1897060 RepID=UPI00223DF2DF|nr:hypothetical protein [Cryobacterium sp. SO2]WEO78610.1 hypothetical protein BJQ94_06135 [Cryobacterium sp. SO2]
MSTARARAMADSLIGEELVGTALIAAELVGAAASALPYMAFAFPGPRAGWLSS